MVRHRLDHRDDLADIGHSVIVDVHDEARILVEELVFGFIQPAAQLCRQNFCQLNAPIWLPRLGLAMLPLPAAASPQSGQR